ncbi:MAG: hypothetical protein IT577_20965 [Verrucomicrobiae bacterium]|nr:hypothetical protein [Verrucomicrobiae bacterium]
MIRPLECPRRSAPPIHPLAGATFAMGFLLWLLAVDQPGAVVGATLASFAWLARDGQFRQTALFALPPALMMAAINAFFSGAGSTILSPLPAWWPGASAITLEAVAFGAIAGAKLATVMATFALWARLSDTDRSLGLLGKAAPRTAVTLGIVIQLIPSLLREARQIQAILWSQGIDLRAGTLRSRAAAAGLLWRTLLASALEGARDLAEALAARGFGSGPRSFIDPDHLTPRDRVATAAGALLATAALALAISGTAQFHFYPRLTPTRPAISLALAAIPVATAALAWFAWRAPTLIRRHARAC